MTMHRAVRVIGWGLGVTAVVFGACEASFKLSVALMGLSAWSGVAGCILAIAWIVLVVVAAHINGNPPRPTRVICKAHKDQNGRLQVQIGDDVYRQAAYSVRGTWENVNHPEKPSQHIKDQLTRILDWMHNLRINDWEGDIEKPCGAK